MKKRILTVSVLVLVLVLALFAFTACNNASSEIGEELVINGDFSIFGTDSSNKNFDGWTASGDITFGQRNESDDDAENSRLFIRNSSSQYSYLKQTVKVDTNKIYKVSVDIKVDTVITANGAHVTFLENEGYVFAGTTTTNGQWKTNTFYVRPKNTDYLTIALCLGSKDAPSSGTVLFDNVSVQRVDKTDVPDGYSITDFRKAISTQTNVNPSGIAFVVCLSLLTVALLVCAYILIRRLYASPKAFISFDGSAYTQTRSAKSGKGVKAVAGKWYQNVWFIAAILALGTFLVRLILMLTMYGYGNIMTEAVRQAKFMGSANIGTWITSQNGGNGTFFLSPGTAYILAIIGAASTNLSYLSTSILIRFINVLADIAVVMMIYFYGRKHVGNRLSTIYAGLYALLPFVFVMSGVNGSFESVLVALMLGAVLLMVDKKYLFTYLLMSLAIVLDVRSMAIAPIMLAYMGYMYYRDDSDKKKFTKNRAIIVFGLVGAFVMVYLLSLPIAITQISAGDAFYNFKYMAMQITTVNYFVKDAFNLYGMVAMNGRKLTNGVAILNLIFVLVFEIYVVSLYFKNRNKQEIIMLASFTFAVLAVFTLKVNYTFLFLAIAFALIYTMISGDKRMFLIAGGYALLGFLDVAQLLNISGFVTALPEGSLVSYETTNPFFIIFCVLNVLLTGYYVYVSYSITTNTKIVDIKAMNEPFVTTVKKWFEGLAARMKRTKTE